MPYKRISELPSQIRQSLRLEAQEEYLKVFNHVWEQYKDDESVADYKEMEIIAHQLAWEAIIAGQTEGKF